MPKKKTNERTSARVAKIAGEILAWKGRAGMTVCLVDDATHKDEFTLIRWRDIRALAASALTQAPNKGWITRRNAAAKKAVKRKRRRVAK